ncbi:MAG: aminotransferase class IV [Campylobacterales bacterium]|nr:aminotransferase class IV [Campylobacterales bacterium]
MEQFLETIKAKDGEVYNIEYHQNRYGGSRNLLDYLNPPSDGLYRCRVVYDDNSIEVTYHPYQKRVIKSLKLVYDDAITYDRKSLNRTKLDALFEQRGFCDDVLIIKNSLITDTTIANLAFLASDGIWYTPKTPLLKGTTRARYLDKGLLKEADISQNDLENFKKVALLNAMIDFDIISSIKIEGVDFVREYN